MILISIPSFLYSSQKRNTEVPNKTTSSKEGSLVEKNIEIDAENIFTLEKSIKIALRNNQNIRIAQAKINSAKAKLKQIDTDFLPKLSADFSNATSINDKSNIVSSAIILKQPIYTGGKLTVSRQKAKIGLDLVELDFKKTINELILQTKKAYFTILAAREYKKIAEESMDQLKVHLYAVKKKYEQKLVPKVEVLKAEVYSTKAERDLVKADKNLKFAKETFNSILDRNLDAEVEVLEMPDYDPVAISLSEFLRLAYKNRPELQQIDTILINNKLDVKLARSKKFPQISFDAQYEWQKDVYIDRDGFVVGLSATMNIWDWGAINQEINQAKFAVEESQNRRILLKKEVELKLRKAYYTLTVADKTIYLAKKNMNTAKEYFKKEKIRFKNGLANNENVLDAQIALTQARAYYTTVTNGYNIARANLAKLIEIGFLDKVEKPLLQDLSDDEFLDLISKKAFYYFVDNQHPKTGLFADASGGGDASIAVTGFGLTALCIGAERGWMDKKEAERRTLKCLNTFIENPQDPNDIIAEGKDGFFYHFLDMETAKRAGNAEVSTVDTALLLCGVITAGEYFGGEVKKAAETLYQEVKWDKFLDKYNIFYMGWSPEEDFLRARWNVYTDETMLINLLAIGSPTHPITPEAFYAWSRKKGSYKDGKPFVCSWQGALFTYQYAHAWFDFKDKLDKEGVDWWQNSVNATKAGIEFCLDNADKYKGFGKDSWGITSYDTPQGYNMSHGFPPCLSENPIYDGTISPSGPAGSMVFTPIDSFNALRNFYVNYPNLWGPYGFRDSFNLDNNWYSQQYFGLGAGITLLMIENFKTDFAWKYFMKNAYIKDAMDKSGFEKLKK